MSNIQKQHKISPAIAWLTIQKFIIFYCPLDGEHTRNYPVDVFYGDGVSFFVQKKVGQLVTDDDIIIKILWRHKEYQMCFGNQTIGCAMEQAQ